jgi:hypothetical protein
MSDLEVRDLSGSARDLPGSESSSEPPAPVVTSEAQRGAQPDAEVEAQRRAQSAAIEPNTPIRGALRIEVKTSSAEIQAGIVFSVFAKISNPFETEVSIDSVHCEVPVEFKDVAKDREEWIEKLNEDFARQQLRQIQPLQKPASVEAQSKPPQSSGITWRLRRDVRSAERDVGGVTQVVKAKPYIGDSGLTAAVTLQPGDSHISQFTMKTRKWLLFQPATYNLPISIEYTIGGKKHCDTVEFRMSIRSPLKAVMWGAGMGALLGYLLNDLLHQKNTERILMNVHGFWSIFPAIFLITFPAAASILGAALTIVAFARKRDAQPFITVEDFLGGMFVGTVIGYGGQNLLQGFLSTPGQILPSTK